MNVYLNGSQLETDCSTLEDLLKQENLVEQTGIAVALNQEVVSKNQWSSTSLSENDQLIIITATQGG